MIKNANKNLLWSESGQALTEYALIISVIVIAVFIIMAAGFAPGVSGTYQDIQAEIGALP